MLEIILLFCVCCGHVDITECDKCLINHSHNWKRDIEDLNSLLSLQHYFVSIRIRDRRQSCYTNYILLAVDLLGAVTFSICFQFYFSFLRHSLFLLLSPIHISLCFSFLLYLDHFARVHKNIARLNRSMNLKLKSSLP